MKVKHITSIYVTIYEATRISNLISEVKTKPSTIGGNKIS
jgi:hypothetical protein